MSENYYRVWDRVCDDGEGGWRGVFILRKEPAYLYDKSKAHRPSALRRIQLKYWKSNILRVLARAHRSSSWVAETRNGGWGGREDETH